MISEFKNFVTVELGLKIGWYLIGFENKQTEYGQKQVEWSSKTEWPIKNKWNVYQQGFIVSRPCKISHNFKALVPLK